MSSHAWIETILHDLRNSGAALEVLSDFSVAAGDKTIWFVPASTPLPLAVPGDMVVHEDLFHTRKKQVMSRLTSQLGLNQKRIHGRLTRAVLITRPTAEKFVNENHLMGFGGGKTFLGLYLKEVLVAVAVFSKIREMRFENPPYLSAELERYCSLADTTVTGGLHKVISFYARHFKAHDLVTHIDLEWSEGASYEKLGFEEVTRTPPLCFAIDRASFQRRIILTEDDLRPNEYAVHNRGNRKLRKWLVHPAEKAL